MNIKLLILPVIIISLGLSACSATNSTYVPYVGETNTYNVGYYGEQPNYWSGGYYGVTRNLWGTDNIQYYRNQYMIRGHR